MTRLNAMFERFTDKAIRVLMAGQQEAQSMGYSEIGSEQLLLGVPPPWHHPLRGGTALSLSLSLDMAQASLRKTAGSQRRC